MNRLLLSSILFLAMSYSVCFGQSDSVKNCSFLFKGHIYDGNSKNPLIGATVFLPVLKIGTASSEEGAFKVSNICKGIFLVKISYLGFKTIEIPLEISGNTHLDFSLFSDSSTLESIVVMGTRDESNSMTQATSLLTAKDLDRSRGLGLSESLKQLPGLFTFQTGPTISKPVLHGMHSNRLLIMNAGLRQEAQQWGAEHAPEIDPFVANQLTVVKGAAGLKYGSDAMAGAILVEPKSLKDIGGVGGEVHLGGFSNNRMAVASAIVEGSFNNVSALKWRAQGSTRQAGSSAAPTYMLSNTGFKEENFSLSLGYFKNKIELDAYYSRFQSTLGILPDAQPNNLTDLSTAIQRTQPRTIEPFTYAIARGYQSVVHDLVRFKASFYTGVHGKVTAIVGSQWNSRQEYDRHAPLIDSLRSKPQYDLNLSTQSAEVVYDHFQSPHFSGQYGVSAQIQNHQWDGTRYLIPNYQSASYGAFWIEKWKRNRIELEAGVRYDIKNYRYFFSKNQISSDSSYQYQNVSGNIGMAYQVSPSLTWKNNVGLTFRPPTPNEMFVNGQVHGSVFVEVGNSSFKAEQGYKFISNLVYRHTKISFETSLHYSYIFNFIYLKPTLLFRETRRGQLLEFEYTQTNASFYGIDISLLYSMTKELEFIAKGSAVNAYNETFQNFLVYIPPYRGELAIQWKPTFVPVMKQNEVYALLSTSLVARQDRIDPNSDFAPPPSGYSLLNMEVGTNIKVANQTWFLSLQVNNLLNTSYREYMNRYRYFADEPGRNFLLRLKIPFKIYQPKRTL